MVSRLCGRKPKDSRVQDHRGLVQDAQHDALPEGRRDGREAQVDVTAGDLDPDPSILGQTLLRDVQVAHDLDAARDRGLKALRRADDLLEHTVFAEADHDVSLVRLDVDIARPLFDGLVEDGVHQADDRSLIILIQDVFGLVIEVMGQALEILLLEVTDNLVCARPAIKDPVHRGAQGLARDDDEASTSRFKSTRMSSMAKVLSGSTTARRTLVSSAKGGSISLERT